MKHFLAILFLVCAFSPVFSAEPIDPGANSPDEAKSKSFSSKKAIEFLDNASLSWQKERKCFACHTNYAYLYARPMVEKNSDAEKQVRAFAEELVNTRWKEKGPRWDAEIIATAAALAFNDSQNTGKLAETTRIALDKMWTVQRDDGGWTWLKCAWPPMESDDHYGVTLAVLAVGFAPGDYAKTPQAIKGLEKAKQYFAKNSPEHLHHKAMLLWANTFFPGIINTDEKTKISQELLSKQLPDGGWSGASLGEWKRADKKEQDPKTSDGYGTGFTIYVLRKSGIPENHDAIKKGIAWIKSNQRESGRWFTRSLNRDNKHYLTNVGSAFALMALTECAKIAGE